MISIEGLLGIVATEAIERGGMSEEQWEREGCPIPETPLQDRALPPIDYKLELTKNPDGTYSWVE